MTAPGASPFADAIYAELGPLTRHDADHGYPLYKLIHAAAHRLDPIDLLASGPDGWTRLFDVDTTPAWALPWLAQWVGVTIPDGLDVELARDRIRTRARWQVGSPASIIAAAREHLTDDQLVDLHERAGAADPDDDPWHFIVQVFTVQLTTSASALRAAIERVAPAELQFTTTVLDGATYGQLAREFTTVGDFQDAFADATVGDVRTHLPPREILS